MKTKKMRDIKFRAWDDGKSEWLLGYELTNLGGFSMFGETMMMGEYAALMSRMFSEGTLENLVIEQYTGLKDHKGKEIYEGDIVEIKNNPDEKDADHMQGTYKVWFNPQSLTFEGDYATPLTWGGTESVIIIGNVHQNPELI